MYIFYIIFTLVAFVPSFIYAQFATLLTIINMFTGVVNNFIRVAVAVALVFFVWGGVSMISANSDNERTEGKKRIIWGLVGLFAIVSLWGIVAILIMIFGPQNVGGMHLPPIIQWGR